MNPKEPGIWKSAGVPSSLIRFGPRLYGKTLVVVFVGEFAVMQIMKWLELPWGMEAALLDSVLLTLLAALPLAYFVLRPTAALTTQILLGRLYRDLIDNSGDLIQSVGASGRFLFVNRKWRQTLGYSKEEMRRMKFTDILRPDQIPHCKRIFAALQRGEAAPLVQTVFRSKDGREIEVEGSISPRMSEGRFAATRAFFRDVTDRKRLQLLESILPVCSLCGKIRDDTGTEPGQGSWSPLPEYVERHSAAKFSHGFCPDCYRSYRLQQGLPPAAASKPEREAG